MLSEQILDAAIGVHRILGGPGLLESLYEDALFYELRLRNIPALSQVSVPVAYKNYKLRESPLRLPVSAFFIFFVRPLRIVEAVFRDAAAVLFRDQLFDLFGR